MGNKNNIGGNWYKYNRGKIGGGGGRGRGGGGGGGQLAEEENNFDKIPHLIGGKQK